MGLGERGYDRFIDNHSLIVDQILAASWMSIAVTVSLFLAQAAKLEQGGGVRCGLPRKIDANEAPERMALVEGFFAAFVIPSEAQLGYRHTHPALQADRRMALSGYLRVERLNLGHKRRPRPPLIDLAKKQAAPRDLLIRSYSNLKKLACIAESHT